MCVLVSDILLVIRLCHVWSPFGACFVTSDVQFVNSTKTLQIMIIVLLLPIQPPVI